MSHLENLNIPANEYSKIADINLTAHNHTILCHSAVLSLSSKVLCSLFSSTSSESWTNGLEAAFNGHSLSEIQAFLKMCYSPRLDVSNIMLKYTLVDENGASTGSKETEERTDKGKDNGTAEGLLKLIHRLDCPELMRSLDAYFTKCPEAIAGSWAHRMSIASNMSMKGYRKKCAVNVLQGIFNTAVVDSLCFIGPPPITSAFDTAQIHELSSFDLQYLLHALLANATTYSGTGKLQLNRDFVIPEP